MRKIPVDQGIGSGIPVIVHRLAMLPALYALQKTKPMAHLYYRVAAQQKRWIWPICTTRCPPIRPIRRWHDNVIILWLIVRCEVSSEKHSLVLAQQTRNVQHQTIAANEVNCGL